MPNHKSDDRSETEACLEHVLVELLVELLVGVVDAELLERVQLKDLETRRHI